MKKYLVIILISIIANANAQIVQQTLVFPHQGQHVHASSLVNLPNGDMLITWFQGSGERKEDDVRIMGARLKKEQKTWSAPFLMADTPHLPDCNPVLFLNKSEKLFLVWIAVQANLWEQSILKVRTSTDYSKEGAPVWNWQDNILLKPDAKFAEEMAAKFKKLPEAKTGWAGYAPKYDEMIVDAAKDPSKRSIGWMTRIKPLVMDDGKIVLPLYSDGYNLSMMAISKDNGNTWLPGLPLVGRGPIQPAVVVRKNGNLVAYMRDSGDPPTRVHISESADGGQSWEPSKKTDIPNTASVELLVLKDGRWAFLGNDIDDGRYKLNLLLSDDEGKTWKSKVVLEDDTTKKGGFSYPSLVQSNDGFIHLSYSHHPEKGKKSIKYVVVDPAKIK